MLISLVEINNMHKKVDSKEIIKTLLTILNILLKQDI